MPLHLPGILPTSQSRNRALHEWLNQLADAVRSLDPVVSHRTRTSHTSIGILREGLNENVEPDAATPLTRCVITEIVSVSSSYFKAAPYLADGTGADPNATTLFVAVPFYLRPTSYNGVIVSGTQFRPSTEGIRASPANSATAYVPMSVFPGYDIGQDVYVFEPLGKTDVTVPDGTIPNTTGVQRLTWMDANVDGRHLETGLKELEICRLEGGVVVQRHVLVRGGPIY